MAKVYDLLVRARGETKDAERAMKQLQRSVRRSGEGMKSAGAAMTKFVTLPILAAGAASVKLASDAVETKNKLDVTFGKSLTGVTNRLDAFAKATGASRYELREQVGVMGALLKSAKLTDRQLADMSVNVVQLATDLGSFHNVNADEALKALRSGLSGEIEPLRRFGVFIDEAAVKQRAMKMGLAETQKQLTAGDKIQARYALILEQTHDAQDDATRTAGSFANQLKATRNSIKDIGISFGNILLPYAQKALGVVRDLTSRFQTLSPHTQKMIVIVGGLAAAIGPLLFGLGVMVTGFSALLPVIVGISLPMLAAGAAIGGLAAALVVAYAKSDKFRSVVNNALRSTASSARELMVSMRATFVAIGKFWDKWGDDIMRVVGPILRVMGTLFVNRMQNMRDMILGILALMRGDWSQAFGLFKGIVQRNLSLAADAAKVGGRLVLSAIKAIPGALLALAGLFYNAGKKLGAKVVDAIVDAVKGAAGRIGSAAADAASDALSAVADSLPGIGRAAKGKKGRHERAGVDVLGNLFGSNVSIGQVMGYVQASSGSPYSVSSNEDGTETLTENKVVKKFLEDRVKANTKLLNDKIARRKVVLAQLKALATAYNKLKREKAAAAKAKNTKLAAAKGKAMSANLEKRAALGNELEDLNTEIIALGGQIQGDNEALVPPEVDSTPDEPASSVTSGGDAASSSDTSSSSSGIDALGSSPSLSPAFDPATYNPLLPGSPSAIGAVADSVMRAMGGNTVVINASSGDPEAIAHRVAFYLGSSRLRAGGAI